MLADPMGTAESRSGGRLHLGPHDDGEEEQPEAPPPVVAVLVARDPGPVFEAVLAGLDAQDYPALSVVVVDAGSGEELTERVRASVPDAHVRRLEGDPSFGAAANVALDTVTGAAFFLVCRDDSVLAPEAVRLMVEEAYRSNAAIVGPKLVDAANPEILLEVGRAIDRLGFPHTGIERDELDQEQHDAVRDVFYVPDTAMLLRGDLWAELGGFDPETSPGSEDLDLCWRARIAGARVIVVPDARAARHLGSESVVGGDNTPNARARARVRAVLKACSAPTLVWVVPFGLALSVVEALVFAVTRRRHRALAEAGAWFSNLLHLPRVLAARQRTQAERRVHDFDLRELQVGPTARLQSFLSHHHADERLQTIGEAGRHALDALSTRMRHPATFVMLGFCAFVVIGSRLLVTDGVPQIGTMLRWPGIGTLGEAFSSAWRYTGMGSESPASPALALMSGLGTVLFGAVGFARTILVVGAFPIGAFGAYRVGRELELAYGPAMVVALVYGISPVPRNAVAGGQLGPLVLFALAPFVVRLVVRIASRTKGANDTRIARTILGLAVVSAVACAWYPPALLVAPVVALVLLVAAPLVGGFRAGARALVGALVAAGLGLVLLVPWPFVLAHADGDLAAFGLRPRPPLSLGSVLRFQTGPSGAGVASFGLFAVGALALVTARGTRFAWAARAWLLAAAGFAVVYLPGRLASSTEVPAPEAGLTLAALGLAAAAGLGAATFADELRRTRFGWRQLVAVAAAGGMGLAGMGFLADTIDGRWRAPADDWSRVLAWTRTERPMGDFRILWVGDPSVLPLEPMVASPRLAYTLTRNGPGDAREGWRAPARDADHEVGKTLRLAIDGRTTRAGRLLAPMGVKYLVVPERVAPEEASVRAPVEVKAALEAQLDLVPLRAEGGLLVYQNASWAPMRALVTGRAAGQLAQAQRLTDLAAIDLGTDSRPLGARARRTGTVLFAESHARGWHAEVDGRRLEHLRGPGSVNVYPETSRGAVMIAHDRQWVRWAFVVGDLIVWLGVLVLWVRDRRRYAAVAVPDGHSASGPMREIDGERGNGW